MGKKFRIDVRVEEDSKRHHEDQEQLEERSFIEQRGSGNGVLLLCSKYEDFEGTTHWVSLVN